MVVLGDGALSYERGTPVPFVCGDQQLGRATRKVDVRLPGKENSHSHGAKPVHLIIRVIVDSDQWVVNQELSLSWTGLAQFKGS